MTLAQQKMLFVVAMLSGLIALGKVEATTSHGLDTLLGGLLTLSGGFTYWAFGEAMLRGEKNEKDDR